MGIRRSIGKGERCGRWTVTDPGVERCVCICDCGTVKSVITRNLWRGTSLSCGCLSSDVASKLSRTHGETGSPEYTAWENMRARCDRPQHPSYKNYGARGIKYCERWKSYEAFKEDMGCKPYRNYSLERKDNDQGYCKENCIWASRLVQSNNTRLCRKATLFGVTKSICDWAREYGLAVNTISGRLILGWGVEAAITTPVKNKSRRKREAA